MEGKHAQTVAAAVAFAVPFIAYIATATATGHWLDTGEFIAVASEMGIAHPPGHPLSSILFGLAHFIPFGSLALRVACVCAFFASAASTVLFRCFERSLRLCGFTKPVLQIAPALIGTLWVSLGTGWWMQAIRPEVYALQALVSLITIERLLAFEEHREPSQLYEAAFFWGLGLCNHHYLSLLLAPMIVLVSIRLVRLGHTRLWTRCIGWTFAGLLTYAFLPLRSWTKPFLNLGSPTNPANFFWTISAKAFQKSVSEDTVEPFLDRLADVSVALVQDMGFVVIALAIVGAYAAFRIAASRRIAFVWFLVFAAVFFGRVILGFVRGNPDALGYIMLATVALGFFFSFLVAFLLKAISDNLPDFHQELVVTVAILFCLVPIVQLDRNWVSVSLFSFDEIKTVDDANYRELPENSLVFAYHPQTVFRYWGARAEERTRPDVLYVPMPLLHYPGLVDRLVEREPMLKDLLTTKLVSGKINVHALHALARVRPVFMELDLRVPEELWPFLSPYRVFHRVISEPIGSDEEAAGAEEQKQFWTDTYRELHGVADDQTRAYFLWHHYMNALYFARTGDRTAASESIRRALSLNPETKELHELQTALRTGDGPLDIAPFMVAN
ncbi:MAG: DUF2723 domain-containing protein [Polyangiales bacterium]